jgi:hypothetical protein
LVIAAVCVAFSPPLSAAIEVETFTDYDAFLKLLGPTAQVISFDDVPTPNGYAYLDPNYYAGQGIVFRGVNGTPTVLSDPAAVSPPNVYSATFAPGAVRDDTVLSFTRDDREALTSAFGAFFIGNHPIDGASITGLELGGVEGRFIAAGFTQPAAFLGVATVDSLSGDLVPAISAIDVHEGEHNLHDSFVDNFTFATPVPEGNVWVLLAATALSAVVPYRRRAAASAR